MNVLLAGAPEGPPDLLVAVVLLGVAAAGTATVLTRDPLQQAVVASFFGLLLGVAFLVLQAPDVALSQITVGAVALPLMILLALAKVRRQPVATPKRPPEGEAAPEPRQEEG